MRVSLLIIGFFMLVVAVHSVGVASARGDECSCLAKELVYEYVPYTPSTWYEIVPASSRPEQTVIGKALSSVWSGCFEGKPGLLFLLYSRGCFEPVLAGKAFLVIRETGVAVENSVLYRIELVLVNTTIMRGEHSLCPSSVFEFYGELANKTITIDEARWRIEAYKKIVLGSQVLLNLSSWEYCADGVWLGFWPYQLPDPGASVLFFVPVHLSWWSEDYTKSFAALLYYNPQFTGNERFSVEGPGTIGSSQTSVALPISWLGSIIMKLLGWSLASSKHYYAWSLKPHVIQVNGETALAITVDYHGTARMPLFLSLFQLVYHRSTGIMLEAQLSNRILGAMFIPVKQLKQYGVPQDVLSALIPPPLFLKCKENMVIMPFNYKYTAVKLVLRKAVVPES